MNRPRPAAPLLTLLPSLALVPVLIVTWTGLHGGGLSIWQQCLSGALHPSLDPNVLRAVWHGLGVTMATAFLSWSLSLLFGVLLGSACADVVWRSWAFPTWPAKGLRGALAIPRALHELVWGLLLLQVFGLHPYVAVAAIAIPYSALVARIWRDHLDSADHRALNALISAGVHPLSALMTALNPGMGTVLMSYGGYRLECALRSATLLGVFGLGGLGTELQLTLQSLQFRELWTGLWVLAAVMLILEQLLRVWRGRSGDGVHGQRRILLFAALTIVLGVIGMFWLRLIVPDQFSGLSWIGMAVPSWTQLSAAATELPWLRMILETLVLTLLAAGIAIGLPPLALLLWPSSRWHQFCSMFWACMRWIPPPLMVLLLLLSNRPSLAIGALAIGLHNSGVMGRLLLEGLQQQSGQRQEALRAMGSSERMSWLYGLLSPQSPSYLAYGAYRSDVILRETVVVGVIGGSGLGWQLLESLSSFHWAAVVLVLCCYCALTISGESLSDSFRSLWLQS
ncbi:phosphonate ABC transporter [Synechococcus sp. CC9311]|uniref:phosphonate ABC transporter n=1 Tax=Synechococcus sp. (strain CC9311) TaxID=64471 RepID=UPI0000DDAF6C|nr:phosphonate ABC transporter [Synechococcus sp. CC9311]ABI45738.1 ABC-type phosphate/phosphonate transport system permease component [Synechococcus sp. CC9311]